MKHSVKSDGLGVPIESTRFLIEFALKHLIGKTEIFNGEALLPGENRPMVFIAAHGPLTAPMALLAVLGKYFLDHGLGRMVAGFYPHAGIVGFPGVKQLYARFGTPTRAYKVPELVRLLKERRMHITGTAPEGVYCNFSWKDKVGPLATAGMVEAVILADADLCLLAHKGGEAWNLQFNLPFGLTVPFTRGLRGVNVPLPPVLKVKHCGVLCRRHVLGLTAKDLAAMSHQEKRVALGLELEKIRAKLILMMEELEGKLGRDG